MRTEGKTTVSAEETEAPQPAKRRGRPRNPVEPGASERNQADEEAFYALMATLEPDTVVYLYPLDPTMDFSQVGQQQKNLTKVLAREFNREWLKQQVGMGVWLAQVGGNGPKQRLRMLDPDVMTERPKYDLRAVVPIDENAYWFKHWKKFGWWPVDGHKEEQPMSTEAIKAFSQLTERVMQRDGGGTDKMYELMMAQMAQQQNMILALIQAQASKPATPANSELTQYLQAQLEDARRREERAEERHLALLDEARRTPGSEMSWPEAFAEGARHAGPALAEFAASLRASGGPAPMMRPPAANAPPTISAAAEAESPAAEGATDMTLGQKLKAQRYLREAIEQFMRGGTGGDFAVYLVGVKGEGEIYQEIRSIEPADAARLIMQQGDWRAAVARLTAADHKKADERLLVWLGEFAAAYSDEPEEEAAAEPEPAKKRKASAKRKAA